MHRFRPLIWLFACVLSALSLQAAADTRPFAWRIAGDKGTVHLLGSVHVGSEDFYPFPPAVEQAFGQSEILVVEADPRDQTGAGQVLARGFYPVGDSLKNHVPQSLLERLGKQLGRYGLSLDVAAGMRPFMILTLIEMGEAARAGYSAEHGVDLHFLERATARGMEIAQLESIAQQLALMDSFTDAESQAMLEQAISSLESGETQTGLLRTIEAWQAGDMEKFERAVEKSLSGGGAMKSAMEKINFARNADMARKIEDYLESGKSVFVIVGALHLVGERGLLNLLRKKGYRVAQL